MQIVTQICDETIDECLNNSSVLLTAITVLLPALLLYLWQALVLPRGFYFIALFEKAHTSLSSIDRYDPHGRLHSDGLYTRIYVVGTTSARKNGQCFLHQHVLALTSPRLCPGYILIL